MNLIKELNDNKNKFRKKVLETFNIEFISEAMILTLLNESKNGKSKHYFCDSILRKLANPSNKTYNTLDDEALSYILTVLFEKFEKMKLQVKIHERDSPSNCGVIFGLTVSYSEYA